MLGPSPLRRSCFVSQKLTIVPLPLYVYTYTKSIMGDTDTPEEVVQSIRDVSQDIPRLPVPRPRDLTPTGLREHNPENEGPIARFQQSAYFKIPPNIRRDIIRLAFGDNRLHMNLLFGTSRMPLFFFEYHRHEDENDQSKSSDDEKRWWWWGLVCRRFPPGGPTEPMTRGGCDGPWADECVGVARHPDESPKYHIGVMGWLLSCRQKYVNSS